MWSKLLSVHRIQWHIEWDVISTRLSMCQKLFSKKYKEQQMVYIENKSIWKMCQVWQHFCFIVCITLLCVHAMFMVRNVAHGCPIHTAISLETDGSHWKPRCCVNPLISRRDITRVSLIILLNFYFIALHNSIRSFQLGIFIDWVLLLIPKPILKKSMMIPQVTVALSC